MVNVHRREGTVCSIERNTVIVRIRQQSACTGCHAKDFCCSTDCAERYIQVPARGGDYAVGETVLLEGDDRHGRLAVLLSFVVPIALLLISLSVCIAILHTGELASIAIAIGVLALYYGVLRLMNGRLSAIIRFNIRKLDQAS